MANKLGKPSNGILIFFSHVEIVRTLSQRGWDHDSFPCQPVSFSCPTLASTFNVPYPQLWPWIAAAFSSFVNHCGLCTWGHSKSPVSTVSTDLSFSSLHLVGSETLPFGNWFYLFSLLCFPPESVYCGHRSNILNLFCWEKLIPA